MDGNEGAARGLRMKGRIEKVCFQQASDRRREGKGKRDEGKSNGHSKAFFLREGKKMHISCTGIYSTIQS
jgi:hypothetical protein